jgi:tetratricopeptide (TPR) repeat protein
MEVAVNTSSLVYRTLTLVLGCLLVAVSGCADQITHSQDSRAAGVVLLDKKDYVNAAGAFRNAVKQEPRDYASHYYLGVCYTEMKQPQLAIKSLKTGMGVPLSRNDPEMRQKMVDQLARCVALYDHRDTELNLLEAQAKIEPSAENYWVLARTYRYRTDPDMAIRAYNQAIASGPQEFAIVKDYGLYLLDPLKRTKEAEAALRRAYAINPEDKEVQAGLRQLGIVPGPSLQDPKGKGQPSAPRSSLPEINPGGNARPATGANIRPPRD